MGCRKGLAPTADDNQAPETWITAAPQDTITTRNEQGVPQAPQLGRIPVRFHMYWAGADRDGAVTGFYWAVVETLAIPSGDNLPLPQLPGPKARDYHYTSKTDSIFIFHADENISEREHAFYIYAVDNKGKADPTPARFVFRAYDRFPPRADIYQARAEGTVYQLIGSTVVPRPFGRSVTDSFYIGHSFPNDTVASGSVLTFKWRGLTIVPNTTVTGYRYKLDETTFNVADTSVHTATYNTRVGNDIVSPGLKLFTLRALGQSGWRGESTRYFQMNFAPDEWYAGPDLNDPLWTTYTDGNGKRYWYADVSWANWSTGSGLPGTLLSADSVNVLPALRPNRRTFLEIYKDRIWAHVEGDTVNINSWVIIPSGGSDIDSPYRVKVGVSPNMPIGPVTMPGGANGSPIGFRSLGITRKPNGQVVSPTETTTYPVFDVSSVYDSPNVLSYMPMSTTGKSFVYAVAEDGDGTVDRRIERAGGVISVIDSVDSGHGSLLQNQIRDKALVFYVNHAPYLKPDPQFLPTAGSSWPIGSPATWKIFADDLDPIDFSKPILKAGGPQSGISTIVLRTVDIRGTGADGRDTTYNVATNSESPNFSFVIPTFFVPGAAHVLVTLCDFRPEDAANANFGRCSPTPIDIPIVLTGPVPADVPPGASQSTQRPGSTPADGRRQ